MKENKTNICAFLCIATGCILLTYTVSVLAGNFLWNFGKFFSSDLTAKDRTTQ